jgi:hypothetical protein
MLDLGFQLPLTVLGHTFVATKQPGGWTVRLEHSPETWESAPNLEDAVLRIFVRIRSNHTKENL